MSKDLTDFSKIVIETIRKNRTKKSPKAGRQISFILKATEESGYSEKESVGFLNLMLKNNILALVGSIGNNLVVIHKIFPKVIMSRNSGLIKFTTETGIKIFQPKLYVVEDGFPKNHEEKRGILVTSGKDVYQTKPSNTAILDIMTGTTKKKRRKSKVILASTNHGPTPHNPWSQRNNPSRTATGIKNN